MRIIILLLTLLESIFIFNDIVCLHLSSCACSCNILDVYVCVDMSVRIILYVIVVVEMFNLILRCPHATHK